MKYSVVTFGCRVNQADSLGFEEQLRAAGASPSAPGEADLVIVNTCSVTAASDQGARQTIRRVARDNPSVRIVVTGCYASRSAEEIAALPNVAAVVGNERKGHLLSLVRGISLKPAWTVGDALTTAQRFGGGDGSCGAPLEPGIAGRTAFTLRVQTGCDEPCAYCIIPTTRGASRSVPIDGVLREIERVVASGFKEIALTGVHLGSYGRDLVPAASLELLLRAIAARFGGRGVLFRISSLEPMDCTPAIVQLAADHECFAAHFHLPLQHASDRILAAMRRPYTLAPYAALVDDIRRRLPHAAIGTDIIVGFPGESDSDFEALASYLDRAPVTHVHVFPYSDRPGTAAAQMTGKIAGSVVRDRARRIRTISERLQSEFRDAQVGSIRRALTVEDGRLAVTVNYLKLRIPAGWRRNEWIRLRVASHQDGEPLSGRAPLALDDQLSACRADVSAAAFPD